MIRTKPDSYCLSYDLRTTGISAMVHDLLSLYVAFGSIRRRVSRTRTRATPRAKKSGAMRRAFDNDLQEVAKPCLQAFATAIADTTTPPMTRDDHQDAAATRIRDVRHARTRSRS